MKKHFVTTLLFCDMCKERLGLLNPKPVNLHFVTQWKFMTSNRAFSEPDFLFGDWSFTIRQYYVLCTHILQTSHWKKLHMLRSLFCLSVFSAPYCFYWSHWLLHHQSLLANSLSSCWIRTSIIWWPIYTSRFRSTLLKFPPNSYSILSNGCRDADAVTHYYWDSNGSDRSARETLQAYGNTEWEFFFFFPPLS
jgi:hypothetical protein